MKLEPTFVLAAPRAAVWAALTDLEQAVACLPGASIQERNEDGSYSGAFKVRLGPTSADYRGRLAVVDSDAATHAATLQADGTDRRGQGGATATIVVTLREAEADTTRVELVIDYQITGRLAHFGRSGAIDETAAALLAEFSRALEACLSGEESFDGETIEAEPGGPVQLTPARPATPAQPAPLPEGGSDHGLSLVISTVWRQARANPLPIAALIFGFLLALRVFRRPQ